MKSGGDDDGRFAAVLHRQMQVRYVDQLRDVAPPHVLSDGYLDLTPRAFRFTTPDGNRFHYDLDEGLSAIRPDPAIADEFQVYLWGTVFGAVAWLNGFFALHASAVEVGGRAIAFTADSGGGKSTLAAALSAAGLPHLCDDTLVLARDRGRLLAIPDRKPIKLWADGLALTGIASVQPIAAMPGKHFARAPSPVATSRPLADLVLLEDGPDVALVPVKGAAAVEVVANALYRVPVAHALLGPAVYGEWLLSIARSVRVWRLARPRRQGDRDLFGQVTRSIVAALGSIGESTGGQSGL